MLSDPKVIVTEQVHARPRAAQATFLLALMTHAAAQLVRVDGVQKAAEHVYRLADVMIETG